VTRQVVLIRGINVGGKNKVPMSGLRDLLTELGCHDVSTYIASGNVLVDSTLPIGELAATIEKELPSRFTLDDEALKVLVLTASSLRQMVERRPEGFGDEPTKYLSDAIFLMGIDVAEAMKVFDPREGVDAVWPGDGVIYHRRLTALRTKTRLTKVIGTPAYKSMTIRSWATTLKLAELVR